MSLPLRIAGVGRYLPKRIVPNHDLERVCGVSSQWIERHTGVRERRRVSGETSSFMAAEAGKEAIRDAGLEPRDLDLIVNASGTPEQTIPDMSPLVQQHLGLANSGLPGMSIHGTCLSFLMALDVASALLAAGRYQRILVVSADIASCALDYDTPESAVLFGDGAAAAVVTIPEIGECSEVHASRFETYGVGAKLTEIRGGGSRRHPNFPTTTPADNMFRMDGPAVFRLAMKYAGGFFERLQPGLSQSPGEIEVVIPHQSSIKGIRALRRYNIPDEMVVTTLPTLGNCVAASLPLTLYRAVKEGLMQRGQRVLLCGTGAGLTFGGMILTY